MTSYKLAARCWKEQREIEQGSISSHRNYGERMVLSFNEKIQSQYYQILVLVSTIDNYKINYRQTANEHPPPMTIVLWGIQYTTKLSLIASIAMASALFEWMSEY